MKIDMENKTIIAETERLILRRYEKEENFETSTVMFDPEGHPFCLSTVKQ